jgi:hypothetical protein
MKSSYHFDPTKYSLKKFKSDLISRKLIPSRQPLKTGLDEKFCTFQDLGWENLADFKNALNNKKSIESLSEETGIESDYLTLLRREVNSYFPNPVSLEKFSDFSPEHILQLAEQGIKNSKHLFERLNNEDGLRSLMIETGIPVHVLQELGALCDLVRAYGVGPAFARILYDTGIHSLHDLSKYSAQQVVKLYEEQTNKKADFTESDIQFSLDIIKTLQIK